MLTVLIGWYNWKKSIKTTSEIESDFFFRTIFSHKCDSYLGQRVFYV